MLVLLIGLLMNISTWGQSTSSSTAEGTAILNASGQALGGVGTIAAGQQAASAQDAANEAQITQLQMKMNENDTKKSKETTQAAQKRTEASSIKDGIKSSNGGQQICKDDGNLNSADIPVSNTNIASKASDVRSKCGDCGNGKEKVSDFLSDCNSKMLALPKDDKLICAQSTGSMEEKRGSILNDYKAQCASALEKSNQASTLEDDVVALGHENEKLAGQIAALKKGHSAWASTIAGLGQAGLALAGGMLGVKAARDAAAWEREQEAQKNAEKCEVKCPKLFAQGTPEYRRCVCGGGCGFQYNCNDTPCEEQYTEMDDASLKGLMVMVCKCQKGGMKYNEKTKQCIGPNEIPVNPLAITDGGPIGTTPKTDPATPPALSPTAAKNAGMNTLAGGASGFGAPNIGKADSGGTGGTGKSNYKNAGGGVIGSSYSDFSGKRDDSGGGGNMGAKVDALDKKAEKPKDIAASKGMSVFDLVTQVHESGIQANRFMMTEDGAQTKSVIKTRSRRS